MFVKVWAEGGRDMVGWGGLSADGVVQYHRPIRRERGGGSTPRLAVFNITWRLRGSPPPQQPRQASQLRSGSGCATTIGVRAFYVRLYVRVGPASVGRGGDGGGVLQVGPLSQEDFLSHPDAAQIQAGKTGKAEVSSRAG